MPRSCLGARHPFLFHTHFRMVDSTERVAAYRVSEGVGSEKDVGE